MIPSKHPRFIKAVFTRSDCYEFVWNSALNCVFVFLIVDTDGHRVPETQVHDVQNLQDAQILAAEWRPDA